MFSTLSTEPLVVRAKELRKEWGMCAIFALVVYSYILIHFPVGNHDWARQGGHLDTYQVALGRWFNPVIMGLTLFRQLPLLSGAFALLFYVTAGLLLSLLLEVASERRLPRAAVVICCLLSSLLPFANWTFFFSYQMAVGPCGQALCILSMLLVLRSPTLKMAVIGAVLFCLSMASYQATVNTAACLFWIVSAAVLGLRKDGPRSGGSWRALFHLATSIAGGAVLYKLSLSAMKAAGYLTDTYHFKFVGVSQLPRRALEVLWVSFKHFVTPNPFFPTPLKLILFALALLGALTVAHEVHRRKVAGLAVVIASTLAVIGLAIYSTKIQFLVTSMPTYYRNRFAAFGMPCFYAGFIALGLTLSTGLWWRRLFTVGSGIALWICVVQDVAWQHAQVTQYEYDVRLLNRVIARIESLPGFSYDRRYRLAQMGGIMNIRPARYYYEGPSSPYHNYSVIPGWAPQNPYAGLEPRLKFKTGIDVRKIPKDTTDPHLQQVLTAAKQGQPWPHPSSVSLVGDTIVVLLGSPPSTKKNSKKKGAAHATPAKN